MRYCFLVVRLTKTKRLTSDKNPYVIDLSSTHVWMWELDHKEGRVLKNWCFQTVLLEKTLDSPLDCKEIKSINPKGNKPRILIEKTEVEAEVSILWPPDTKNQLIGKDPDSGKDRRQEEKGMTEDEMVGWHQKFKEHELRQTLEHGTEQGSLACCSLLGWKELDTTWWLNNNKNRGESR